MNLKSLFYSRHYFLKILITITTLILLFLVILSSLIYYNAEGLVLNNQYENTLLSINQLNLHINYVNDSVKKLLDYTYSFNSDLQYLLYTKDKDLVNSIIAINKLGTLENSIAFMHSICVYNPGQDLHWITTKGFYREDKDIIRLFEEYDGKVPMMYPIPRTIPSPNRPGETDYVFTYIAYDNINMNSLDSTVAFNIKSDWLIDNIEAFNTNTKDKKNMLSIIDNRGEFIYSALPGQENSSLKANYLAQTEKLGAKGYFPMKLDGKNYLISYSKVEKLEWVILTIQSLDEINYYVNKLRIIVLFITSLCIILALLASFSVARRLYKPIGSLYDNIWKLSGDSIAPWKGKDEIKFLEEIYKNTTEFIVMHKKIKNTPKEIIKQYFLRKLLSKSSSVIIEDMERSKQEGILDFDTDSKSMVILAQIDDYDEFVKNNRDNIELFEFIIINILSEIIGRVFPNDGISLKDNQLAFLLKVDDACILYDALIPHLREAQELLMKHYFLSTSISISEPVNFQKTSDAYDSALELSAYRFLMGKRSIVYPALVTVQTRNTEFDYSHELEKGLIKELKCSNSEKSLELLTQIFKQVSVMNCSNAVLAVSKLLKTFADTLAEMNTVRIEPLPVDLTNLAANLLKLETLDEVYHALSTIVVKVTSVSKAQNAEDRKLHIIESVKETIHLNYLDNNLCLQQIASSLKLSPYYISKLFKEETNMSVNEYLNEYRLNKALELMESSTGSINEIVSRVGMENISYFYKLFKQKYGATPKEYLLKKSLNSVSP